MLTQDHHIRDELNALRNKLAHNAGSDEDVQVMVSKLNIENA